jgi:hypothetical protein
VLGAQTTWYWAAALTPYAELALTGGPNKNPESVTKNCRADIGVHTGNNLI